VDRYARTVRRILLVVVLLVSCVPGSRAGDVLEATVSSHVDGDTFEVVLDGGRERIRFIGIDTPERGTPGYEAASRFTARAAPVGMLIFLELDIEERDRYRRLLAYVWLDRAAGPETGMLNALLVASGHAVPLPILPNVAYADLFARLARR
jgi:micrococcal nuclease